MNFFEWVSLATICLLGAATPGPSLAIIVGHTLGHNKIAGQLASLAHASVIMLYALATIFGLTALFSRYPLIADIITFTGAAYLLYLAYKLINASNILSDAESDKVATSKAVTYRAHDNEEVSEEDYKVHNNEESDKYKNTVDVQSRCNKSTKNRGYSIAIKDAIFIALLNPKLAFFFLALFSQFVPVGHIPFNLTVILVSTVFFIDLFWYLIVVSIVERSKSKVNFGSTGQKWFLRIQAAIFFLIALNTIIWR